MIHDTQSFQKYAMICFIFLVLRSWCVVFRRRLVLVVFRIILAALLVSSDLPFYKRFTKILHPVLKNLLCRIPFRFMFMFSCQQQSGILRRIFFHGMFMVVFTYILSSLDYICMWLLFSIFLNTSDFCVNDMWDLFRWQFLPSWHNTASRRLTHSPSLRAVSECVYAGRFTAVFLLVPIRRWSIIQPAAVPLPAPVIWCRCAIFARMRC